MQARCFLHSANYFSRYNTATLALHSASSLVNYASDEYQLLHRSELPTDLFQRSLPRLPVPTIENTCMRYLNAQRPLLTEKQFTDTKNIALEFQQGVGRRLQKELRSRDKQNKHTSYISAPWFNMYLSDRRPIVLNYNPYLSFVDDPAHEQNVPAIRAANIIVSALRFKRALQLGVLSPEVFHLNAKKSDTPAMRRLVRLLPRSLASFGAYYYNAYPLDMSQFDNLFGSTRIPRLGRDELRRDDNSRHVLVIRRGHMYVFDGLDENGAVKTPDDIYGCVCQIAGDTRSPNEKALGYLTAENRDTWAVVRQHLVDSGNGEYLRLIDSALFVLVLEDDRVDNSAVDAFKLFLHGDGANRWYDKSFTLVLSGEGKAAINFEHAWGDGVAVLRFFNELYKDTTEKKFVTSHTNRGSCEVRRLDLWNLDEQSTEAIKQARKRFATLIATFDVGFLLNPTMGKNFCKRKHISPDALMQMSFQIAYHRLTNGGTTASYESCSTSAFRHGRTETIRPATDATLALSRAINSSSPPSSEQLLAMIRECSRVHSILTVDAAKGQGCDRHLFALRLLAEESGSLPQIFLDPNFERFNKFIISTSTLSSPAAEAGGFGAVEKDGLGIGYMIKTDQLGVLVSAYPANCDLNGFMDCLDWTYKKLYHIISSG